MERLFTGFYVGNVVSGSAILASHIKHIKNVRQAMIVKYALSYRKRKIWQLQPKLRRLREKLRKSASKLK